MNAAPYPGLVGVCYHPRVVPDRNVDGFVRALALILMLRPVRCSGCPRSWYQNIWTGRLVARSSVNKAFLAAAAVLLYIVLAVLFVKFT